jgi:hypothetical protein
VAYQRDPRVAVIRISEGVRKIDRFGPLSVCTPSGSFPHQSGVRAGNLSGSGTDDQQLARLTDQHRHVVPAPVTFIQGFAGVTKARRGYRVTLPSQVQAAPGMKGTGLTGNGVRSECRCHSW